MIVNFTLEKVAVEKKGKPTGNIEAKNNIKFLDVTEAPLPKGFDKQSLLMIKFEYKVTYLPDIATTDIVGHLHFLTNKEGKDKILKEWDKDAKIDQELSYQLVNYVFSKCGVMALSLSQQVGLPPHIALPRLSIKKKDEVEGKTKPKAS